MGKINLSTAQLKKIFSVIAGKKEVSILWRCTEGKDRCGIVFALFLFLMGRIRIR